MLYKKAFLIFVLFVIGPGSKAQTGKVLIIQDEMPQLEVLSDFLENRGDLEVEMVDQQNLPQDYSGYQAIIGFVHGRLFPEAEEDIIDYTENGGRFVCLHHTISSGKARNEHFFDFLGIRLDHPEFSSQPVEPGVGYGWYHDGDNYITLHLVNLNPRHFITSNKIDWPESITYQSSDRPSTMETYPSLTLNNTEVYMNHKFTDGRAKQVLVGLKYYDPRNNQIFMQDRAVWTKPYGEGEIVYILPGENPSDYENQLVAQMILNAIIWEK